MNEKFLNGVHFMFDFETTALNAITGTAIEIGIVQFSFNFGALFTFEKVIAVRDTDWDAATYKWHKEMNEERLHYLLTHGEHADRVMEEVIAWIGKWSTLPQTDYYFWAKPVHFDKQFWDKLLRQTDWKDPFHYRNYVDLGSFIEGFRHQAKELPDPSYPRKHTALQDAHDQVTVLLEYLKG